MLINSPGYLKPIIWDVGKPEILTRLARFGFNSDLLHTGERIQRKMASLRTTDAFIEPSCKLSYFIVANSLTTYLVQYPVSSLLFSRPDRFFVAPDHIIGGKEKSTSIIGLLSLPTDITFDSNNSVDRIEKYARS